MAILALSISAMAAAPALAQNPNYTAGDLVLTFQNPGGAVGADQTLYVNLGNAATLFRQGGVGTDGASNLLNIVNIGSTLISAFGANWASEITLHAGLAGVWGTASSLSSDLQNGDPNRTLYVSRARQGAGTLGQANSPGWTIPTDTGMSAGANGITAQNHVLESEYLTGVALSPIGVSTIDDQNPLFGPGDQGTAFGAFATGIQQQGAAGSFGSMGPVNNVEFALDLYRILAKNNVAGQVGGNLREGSFEGTVVIDGSGNVSFLAVPEPSAAAFLACSMGALGFIRRRRRA